MVEDELDRMDIALDRGRYLIRRFAALVDAGQPYRRAASVAKAYTCPLAERVIQRVIQHLGAPGRARPTSSASWLAGIYVDGDKHARLGQSI